jgi:hypothetical protein
MKNGNDHEEKWLSVVRRRLRKPVAMADLFGWLFICYGLSGLVSIGVIARVLDLENEAMWSAICIGIIFVGFCAGMAVGFFRRVEFVRKCGQGSFLIAIALVVISIYRADYVEIAICLGSVVIPIFIFAFMLLGSTQARREFSRDDSLNEAAH